MTLVDGISSREQFGYEGMAGLMIGGILFSASLKIRLFPFHPPSGPCLLPPQNRSSRHIFFCPYEPPAMPLHSQGSQYPRRRIQGASRDHLESSHPYPTGSAWYAPSGSHCGLLSQAVKRRPDGQTDLDAKGPDPELSGRLVAAIRMTPSLVSKPSISTSNWLRVLFPLHHVRHPARLHVIARPHQSHQ